MKFIILMLSPCFTDTCVGEAEPFWVFTNLADCQTTADAMNRNADAEHLYCVEEE